MTTRPTPAILRAAIAALALLAGCATLDVSFKTVTFQGADRDLAFDEAEKVVSAHFYGTQIRTDKPGGRIETDPVEEPIAGKTLRQQCYVEVKALADGRVEVAVLARMQQLKVDPGADVPVAWIDVGSDLQVEGILLDEISGRILSLQTEATVVGTTLPRAARPR